MRLADTPGLPALIAYQRRDLQQRRRIRAGYDGKPRCAAKAAAERQVLLSQALLEHLLAAQAAAQPKDIAA